MAVGSQELQGLWLNQDAGAQSMYQQGNGPYNIFILDTSSRLGEDGFQEMKEIFASMIDDLCFKAQQYHFDQDYCDLQMSKKTLNMEDLVL
ncbi:uncharacterized protein LOC111131681 isoform X5 [Crassostrea virginica]